MNAGDIGILIAILIFIMPIIIGIFSTIIGAIKKSKEKKTNEAKQLEFENYAKPYILAQKYLDKNEIDTSKDIETNDLYQAILKIRKEIRNNTTLYSYNSLTLDEQNEYLEKAPLLLIEEMKKICKKLKSEIEKEQNPGFKYYCDDETIKKHNAYLINELQDIIDFNIEKLEDSNSLNDIKIAFMCFMLDYLNVYELAVNSFFDLYGIQLYLEIRSGYVGICPSSNCYFSGGAPEEEQRKKVEEIKELITSPDFVFLQNNIQADYYKKTALDFSNANLPIYNYVHDYYGFEQFDKEMLRIVYLKNLIITYLCTSKKNLLIDYIREIYNIDDSYDNLFDELDKDRGIIFSGVSGEKMVEDEFNIYKDELEYFSNIRFEEDDLSVETDGLIVSERGLFSIEIKNFKFPKIKISKDGQWKKCYYGAGGKLEEEVMKDVGSQMNRHIIITERLFNKHLKEQGIKEKIEIKPMIIIANNDIEIENDSDMVIVRTSQIYNNFKKSNCNYSKKAISEIKKYIKNNKLPAKKYEIINYEKTFENITNSLLENRNKDIELFNEILRVLNEDLPKDLEENMSENNI